VTRLAWLTDLHLDHVDDHGTQQLCQTVVELCPDAILIGGDISNAASLGRHLDLLEQCMKRPIYFVLGNHDFYGGSMEGVRALAREKAEGSRWLHWLPASEAVALTERTALIGHDGWADGRLGNGEASYVLLNDYVRISDFVPLSHSDRFKKLNALGDESADYLGKVLPAAVERFPEVLLLTHVPPFRESCWHEGSTSDDDYLPHFACQVAGEVLADTMRRYPDSKLTVLCGHTHSGGEVRIAPNLVVKTGAAEYGRPVVQELIVVT
jgi:3',5'-cyclic AMP phosphodiesterase CpdA